MTHKYLSIASIAVCALLVSACSGASDSEQASESGSIPASAVTSESSEQYSDLKMFELQGPVQQCETTTFYNVTLNSDNSLKTDTTATESFRVVAIDFDRAGNYLTTNNELVKRDEKGRLTYWRDSTPHAKGVHPGVLRDTLHYTHINDNVMTSDGMGEYTVTVYDNAGRVVGQMSDPRVSDSQTSAFNVYRLEDSHGNWTERLTVWTSKAPGRKPHVSYTVDRRKITYYPDSSDR